MRSGTRTHIKRRWTTRAHRPVCRIRLGYEFCYLYAALCPFSGELEALILPDMSKQSFEVFAAHLARRIKKRHPRTRALLICDGAGAHQKEVCRPLGITLERLPTACPELNPVERLFQELRKEMSNQVYDTLEVVEDHLSQILKKYFRSKDTITQLCAYPYIRT